jgi:hypothetical protein
MRNIELVAFNKQLAVTVQIPLFKGPEPTVIVWEGRVFMRSKARELQRMNWVFVECVAWMLNKTEAPISPDTPLIVSPGSEEKQ